jgi:hypothetical protein
MPDAVCCVRIDEPPPPASFNPHSALSTAQPAAGLAENPLRKLPALCGQHLLEDPQADPGQRRQLDFSHPQLLRSWMEIVQQDVDGARPLLDCQQNGQQVGWKKQVRAVMDLACFNSDF